MPKTATGTVVKTRDGRLQPKITLADGSRMRCDPLPRGTTRARAKEIAAAKTEEARRAGLVSVARQNKIAANQRRMFDAAQACQAWVDGWRLHQKPRGRRAQQKASVTGATTFLIPQFEAPKGLDRRRLQGPLG